MNRQLIQVSPLNFVGAGFSISVLVLATPRVGTTIRKKCVAAGVRTGFNLKKAFLRINFHFKSNGRSIPFFKIKKNSENVQVETLKPQKPRTQNESLIGKNERETSGQVDVRSQSTRAISGGVGYSNQRQMSQEIASECLTCVNLISCKHRRTGSVDSRVEDFDCPLVEQLTSSRNDLA